MSNKLQTKAATGGDGFLNEEAILVMVPICRRSLHEYRKKGIIPSIKLGRRTLYHWPAVQAALLRLERGRAT